MVGVHSADDGQQQWQQEQILHASRKQKWVKAVESKKSAPTTIIIIINIAITVVFKLAPSFSAQMDLWWIKDTQAAKWNLAYHG